MPAVALSRAGARVVEFDGEGGPVLDAGVWARLEALPDPRSPRGRVYRLASLVAVAVCALTAAGHDRLTAVGQWVKRATPAELACFGLPWDPLTGAYRVPDEKTIRTALDRLDPRALTGALLGPAARPGGGRAEGRASAAARDYPARRRETGRRAAARSRHPALAVDGKTSRGARRPDGTRVHLLGALTHGGPLIDQVEVDVKHNEVTHFTDLLDGLDLTGLTLAFDALHTVRGNLDWLVTTKNAHCLAVIKKNQPGAYAKVTTLPWPQVATTSTTRETGHGRTETRTHKISRETVYLLTSLTSAQANSDDLARDHWSIEAHHHIRDVTFGEDNSTTRTGHGPANLATLRATVITALRNAGYLHIPEGRRDHTQHTAALHLHGFT